MATDPIAAAQAVLGGSTAEQTAAVEAQLQAQVVTHLTFDELTNVVEEQAIDLEGVFIP